MNESKEQQPEDITRYSITFSLDEGNYFRRACPSCDRHFKTRVAPGDIASVIQPAFRRLDLDIGEVRVQEEDNASDQDEQQIFCPYCNHVDDSSAMLTQQFRDYLTRYAIREIMLPQIPKMFSGFSDSLNRGRKSTGGMFSIEMSFDYDAPILPPRPISGPELPDMLVVKFLCCNETGKILDNWRDTVTCPFCGNMGVLQ